MKVEDPDIEAPVEGDRDLSLNRKVHGCFHGMAWRVVAKKEPTKKDPMGRVNARIKKLYSRLKKLIGRFDSSLRNISSAVADDFSKYSQDNYIGPTEEGWSNEVTLEKDIREVSQLIDQLVKRKKIVSQSLKRADRDTIVKTVMEAWPSDKRGWSDRAAVIGALDQSIDDIPIPEAFKIPFLRGEISDALQDQKLIRKLIESTSKRLPLVEIEDRVVSGFAQLASAYRILIDNPSSVTESELTKGMDELSVTLKDQSQELLELGSIMEAWHEAMGGFQVTDPKDFDPTSKRDLNRTLDQLDGFFKGSDTIDPAPIMQGLGDYVNEKYEEVPPELSAIFEEFEIDVEEGELEDPEAEAEEAEAKKVREKMGPLPHRASGGAASNGTLSIEDMAHKTATYHGVDDRRGNPTNPANTGYRSYDRRHFTEVHFKSILKVANSMLKGEDWLKYGWEGGSEDAPLRAALDLAISLADDNLYQSKIDAETYDMLLNRLAKWGHDSFSETVLPEKAGSGDKRSAMSKSESYSNIVRVASELRNKDPRMALQIIKSLRALVSTDADPVGDFGSTSMDNPAAGIDTGVDNPTAGIDSTGGIGLDEELVDLGSMGEEDFEALKKEVKEKADRLFNEKEVDAFLDGWDELMQDVQEKTAAAWLGGGIPVPVLIKLAASSDEAKRVLGPVLVAAKKKKDKKKGKKKDKKDEKKSADKGKENPFGDKKAPPFGKGKGKGKGRKAVAIVEADLDW
jgi:hypothetical protein